MQFAQSPMVLAVASFVADVAVVDAAAAAVAAAPSDAYDARDRAGLARGASMAASLAVAPRPDDGPGGAGA